MNPIAVSGRHLKTNRNIVASILVCSATLSLPPNLASSPSGQIVSWGSIVLPYLPPGKTFLKIAAGGNHSLAVLNDGTVIGWGCNDSGQLDIPGGRSNV